MPMDGDFMGRKLTVKITEAGKHYMKCVLTGDDNVSRPEGVPEPLKKGQVSGVDNLQTKTVTDSAKYHPLLLVSLMVLGISLLLRLYYTMIPAHTPTG